MAEGIKTPIEPGIVSRVARGLKYMVTGKRPEDWFGPGEPLPPAAPEDVKGRQFDYPFGFNLTYTPRGDQGISFEQLRALSLNCDLVRLAIETRKDQMCKLKWTVKPREGIQNADRQVKEATALLNRPDRVHTWNQWLRMLLEDMLVIDAATVYPRRTKGGGLYALDPVDGATIKPVLDEGGRTPMPPDPAYQQILKGLPAVNYTRDELIYFPRNPLTWRVYGLSPVEQIILIVNIIMRRQLHLLQYYTDGNLPDALIEVPETWNIEQIKEWQQYWDALHSGNTAQRRQGKWVPHGMVPHPMKEAALKDSIDEWFARVVCYCFSLSPQPFIAQINRATAETAEKMAKEEGLAPLQEGVMDLINLALEGNGFDQVEAVWEEEISIDPKVQAEIDDINIRNASSSVDEVREKRGEEPIGLGHFVMTAQGPVLVEDIINPPEPPPVLVPPAPPGSETFPAPPAPPGEGAQAGKPVPPLKKVKGKKKMKPLDRNRPAIAKARKSLAALMAKALKADAKAVAAQIATAAGLEKAEDDRVEKILRELKFLGIEATVEEVQKVLAQAAQNGGLAALTQINVDAPDITAQVNKLAVEWAENQAAELVGKKWLNGRLVDNPDARWSITESTRDYLRADVTQAVEEGWSSQKLAGAIEENFAFSEGRAEMIARTEIARADVEGNLMAYRESGVVEGKESILGSEHGGDDECDDNADAGIIPLDEPFPSGDMGPPYHPNCVCDVLPVVMAPGEGDQGPE